MCTDARMPVQDFRVTVMPSWRSVSRKLQGWTGCAKHRPRRRSASQLCKGIASSMETLCIADTVSLPRVQPSRHETGASTKAWHASKLWRAVPPKHEADGAWAGVAARHAPRLSACADAATIRASQPRCRLTSLTRYPNLHTPYRCHCRQHPASAASSHAARHPTLTVVCVTAVQTGTVHRGPPLGPSTPLSSRCLHQSQGPLRAGGQQCRGGCPVQQQGQLPRECCWGSTVHASPVVHATPLDACVREIAILSG